MAKNKVTGRYFYDKIFSLIDYRGDIKRKKSNSENFTGYSPDFSPNNIKRLVVSPDGAIVQLHIGVSGVKRTNFVILQAQMYNDIRYLDDYVPMLNCLSEDRICASIEEVVIVPNNSDNTVQLDYIEQDVSGLIKNFRDNGEKDIIELISNRYKRLRDFCIVNSDFETVLKYVTGNIDSFVCDSEDLDIGEVTYIHKDDWFNNYGNSASFYQLDAKDGKLNLHFQKIRDTFESKERSDKLEQFKKEHIKGADLKQANLLEAYNYMFKAKKMLLYFSLKCPSAITGLIETDKLKQEIVKLNNVGTIKKSKTYELIDNNTSSKDAINQNIETLKHSVQKMYAEVITVLLSNLNTLPNDVLRIIMQDSEKSIKVPKSLESLNQEIQNKTGLSEAFEGSNLKNSILNACTLFVNVFISDITDNKKVKLYCNKSAWQKELNH